MDEQRFKVAFAIERYATGEVLDDPGYFKWFAQFYESRNGSFKISEIPMHDCTEKDYADFYPVEKSSIKAVERYKKQGALKCLDLSSLTLRGESSSGEYNGIDVNILPCSVRLS